MAHKVVMIDESNLNILATRFPGLSPNKALTLALLGSDVCLITNKDLEKYIIKEKEEKYT